MEICKVCGKELRQVNWKHLETHDLTVDEYRLRYGDVEFVAEQIIPNVHDWMAHGVPLEGTAEQIVRNVLTDQDSKFRAILSVAALHQIRRMSRLLEAVDQSEAELYKPERIAGAKTHTLLSISRTASDEVHRILDLCKSLTEQPDVRRTYNLIQTNVVTCPVDLLPDSLSREKVRNAVDTILAIIREPEGADGEDEVSLLPVPPEVDED